MEPIVICWFRRDLRLKDNAALYHALRSGRPVLPLFIFDRSILDRLDDKADRRVEFIHAALCHMQDQLIDLGSTLEVHYGFAAGIFKTLLKKYQVESVFANHDYEPEAIDRDKAIAVLLQERGAALHTYKDQVLLERGEVLKDDGKPYTVFTPYSRRWRSTINDFQLKSYPTKKYFKHFLPSNPAFSPIALRAQIPSLESMDFRTAGKPFPPQQLEEDIIRHYDKQRDFPGIRGTSRLGVHLRFGTISIRELARRAAPLNDTYLNELIWRDFYHMILWHFPQVGRGKSFRPEYDAIRWRNNEAEFERWCKGMTGYPIVDAGMRELNATGFMHNRVRMITASFLAKHLLIDWRWGEAYFAEKLLDFDLAANNGGWQWAAGSGCDAAPYFRIFSPARQTASFDKDLVYIRQWVPELDSFSYPPPIVDHDAARKQCLEAYARALKG
jgi:deoxyribodipyrimidine photo-lyase